MSHHHRDFAPQQPRSFRVIPIPLSLLLHPIASDYPYCTWITDAQAGHGGIRLPQDRAGFRMCFEFARAILRSTMSDSATLLDARRFAADIYRSNLEQFGTTPWHGQSSHGMLKRRFDGDLGVPRPAPGRSVDEMAMGNTSISSLASVSGFAGPGTTEDDPMEEDELEVVEGSSLPSPERRRSKPIGGTSSQRAAAPMKDARRLNMGGQWREGCLLVPVPKGRGHAPPLDLPPVTTLGALHAMSDRNLAMWLRFYDGDDTEVPPTRYALEIAVCSRVGVLWSPSEPSSPVLPQPRRSPSASPLMICTKIDEFPRGSPPPSAASAPASTRSSPVSSPRMVRTMTAPVINITPPTPTASPSPPDEDDPAEPHSAPPGSPPPHAFSTRQQPYSYAQTHPSSYAYTHRYQHYPSVSNPFAIREPASSGYAPYGSGPSGFVTGSSAGSSSGSSSTLTSGYKVIMRNGVPYAVRWSDV